MRLVDSYQQLWNTSVALNSWKLEDCSVEERYILFWLLLPYFVDKDTMRTSNKLCKSHIEWHSFILLDCGKADQDMITMCWKFFILFTVCLTTIGYEIMLYKCNYVMPSEVKFECIYLRKVVCDITAWNESISSILFITMVLTVKWALVF